MIWPVGTVSSVQGRDRVSAFLSDLTAVGGEWAGTYVISFPAPSPQQEAAMEQVLTRAWLSLWSMSPHPLQRVFISCLGRTREH